VKGPAFSGLLGFFLGVLSLSFSIGPDVRMKVGGGPGPLMMSGLGPSEAASALTAAEVADGRGDFNFRKIESPESRVFLPVRPRGPFRVEIRMDTTVRTRIVPLEDGMERGESFVAPGPWTLSTAAENLGPGVREFVLRFEDAPLVRHTDTLNFRRYADEIVVRSAAGFDLPWTSRIAGGVGVLLLAWVSAGVAAGAGLLAAAAAPLLLFVLLATEPVALALALPRLLPFAAAGAVMVFLLGSRLKLDRRAATRVSLIGLGMVLAYGFLSFLPGHSPADLDIHIWRTLDVEGVPFSYEGWLRYGSHYPTPSQIRGAATEALGGGPAIPYSPLPYLLFYAAHATGLDLHWAMNALEALSLALLLPLMFALARAASSETGGMLAAALLALDLSTIHHLGRAHTPAVIGGALGLGCLLYFGLALERLGDPGRWRTPALLLGLGALGYSSTPLFYALFGAALIVFLAIGPGTRSLLRPALLALAAGGTLALLLFYGHYLPGLLRGGDQPGVFADPFPGRTFFIFHNESRQSLRLWRLGLYIPFLAAVPALLAIGVRGPAVVRSFLLSWVSAWAGIMLLKEPWALPVFLRWAKEDFYVAPSLALLIAIAIGRVERRPVRLALSALVLVAYASLRWDDYAFHADTLRFLR
jgi:hypothetical protein